MKKIILSLLLFFILLLTSCTQPKEAFNFQGKWQSLNQPNYIIEICEDNVYKIIRDQKPFLQTIYNTQNEFKKLKININEISNNWNTFIIEDEITDAEFIKGRIEVINKDRIRIYFHKHHDILDMADEFHRTENFTSFDEIMADILNEK